MAGQPARKPVWPETREPGPRQELLNSLSFFLHFLHKESHTKGGENVLLTYFAELKWKLC
jgi:hypothetical protein